ncbi:DDT domain-containing protein/WAC_Acf1_DNA_bd domain-containing protein [Cephalotus follicularis]|uniref:DDT domain-containing protein/WAC_Acf1_DNA_bd domain-containing protein n=1 Tax=Cephalotus follicularis TaxID=3775 RepID=A0A1Q3D3K9_CEPFO|nr:DDT domain-containing protein/WAC_Acf1_DNA_bd domain-containing protein [Cephalotus follicularis]
MPLLKRKPFILKEPPKNLEPPEPVHQIRFTKEIFRDYQEYLKRINLYRQRIWTCKSSAKPNLTYEEALVSETHMSEKVQELPRELVAPALHIIQFSMLSLKDLADTIAAKLQECFYVGAEVCGRKGDSVHPCKILEVLGHSAERTQYQVAWLDKNRKILEIAVVHREDLIWKKLPFTRNILKSLIRESTKMHIPWVLHENLVRKHGISTDPPKELRSKFFFQDGLLVCRKKRRENEKDRNIVGEGDEQSRKEKRKKEDGPKVEGSTIDTNSKIEDDKTKSEPIKYPIDDLLVQPDADDPVFTDRPSPSKDFNVPMDCVGDLLMIWDFCTSFSRLLHLWPFSLEDFENAICHKDSQLVLIVESHSALLRLLLKDNADYLLAVQKRKGKSKITLITWTEYLCDFLEMINDPELCSHTGTIKRGYYGLLDANTKLGILRELINQVLETSLFREKLDVHIEQRLVLGATRRGEALEEGRKKREDKEQLKAVSNDNEVMNGHSPRVEGNQHILANGNLIKENGGVAKKINGQVVSSRLNNLTEKSEGKHLFTTLYKISNKHNMDEKVDIKDPSWKELLKQLKDNKNKAGGKRSKDQRREYFEREMEKRVIRTNPLGKDRHYNRYWWLQRDGRIFVESSDSKQWGYYNTKEELDALMGSLNCKGERERALLNQMEKFSGKICLEIQKRSKELAHKIALEEDVLRRSTRVRVPPGENPANAFLKYVNKWKED